MAPKTYVTLEEITSQTIAWGDAFDVVHDLSGKIKKLNLKEYRQILFIGCGSTYYLSLAAATLFQSMTGCICKALPSSELMLFPESVFTDGKLLLIAISRSGATSETLHVVNDFKKSNRGDVIILTTENNSPLFQLGDISIAINKGREKSVAQTRSFSSMYLASTYLAFLFGASIDFFTLKTDFIKTGKRLISTYQDFAKEIGQDQNISQVFFLGSGNCYGLVNEVSLKLKEMSQTVTEGFHFLEFRHGPISMVDARTLVIGLISHKSRNFEKEVLNEAKNFGAKTLTVGESDLDVIFSSGLPEEGRGVLYLPILQMIAYYRAVAFGKNPDSPRQIMSVVKLALEG